MKISRARTNSLSLDVQIFHYMKKLHAIITIKKKMKTKIKRNHKTNKPHKANTKLLPTRFNIHYRRLLLFQKK